MLKKIFGKTEHTLDELIKNYHKLNIKKTGLTNEAESLKKSALSGDTKGLAGKLQKIETEIKLIDSGMNEIKKLMAEILEKQIQEDCNSLPARQEAYQKDFDEISRQAGDMIGKGVMLLESLGRPFPNKIAAGIRGAYGNIAALEQYADDSQGFSAGYVDAMNPTEPLKDFFAERKEFDRIKRRVPGSAEVKRSIEKQVNRLLEV